MRRYQTEFDLRDWAFQSSALPTELPSRTIENKELSKFFQIQQPVSLFYFCPMKRNETHRVADASKPPRNRKGAFDQVFDEDEKRVHGLWIGDGLRPARVRCSPTHISRSQLQNGKTIPQPGGARQELTGIAKDTSNPTQPCGVNTRLREFLDMDLPAIADASLLRSIKKFLDQPEAARIFHLDTQPQTS